MPQLHKNKGSVDVLDLPVADLDHLLAKFFKDIRNIYNGEDYEPDTLSGLQQSIQKFLSEGKLPFNSLVVKDFETSRKVPVAKRKSLI